MERWFLHTILDEGLSDLLKDGRSGLKDDWEWRRKRFTTSSKETWDLTPRKS